MSVEQMRKEWAAEAKNRFLLAAGDLISRKWLFDRFNELNLLETYKDCRLVNATINEAPAVDAVEVVRCDKCRWYQCGEWPQRGKCGHPRYDHLDVSLEMLPFDFCRYGERMEADDIGK